MDYKIATLSEMVEYVEESSAQRISSMLKYHSQRGNEDIVNKIKEARRIVAKKKLLARAAAL